MEVPGNEITDVSFTVLYWIVVIAEKMSAFVEIRLVE